MCLSHFIGNSTDKYIISLCLQKTINDQFTAMSLYCTTRKLCIEDIKKVHFIFEESRKGFDEKIVGNYEIPFQE